MQPARPTASKHLPRLLLYSSLVFGLTAAVTLPRWINSIRQNPHSHSTTHPIVRALQEDRLQQFLSHSSILPDANSAQSIPDNLLATLMEWLASPPLTRPASLINSAQNFQQAGLNPTQLQQLLSASFLAPSAAPPEQAHQAFQYCTQSPPDWFTADLQLDILHHLKHKAFRQNKTALGQKLLLELAQHPHSSWQQTADLIDQAIDSRQTHHATRHLKDLLQNPQQLPKNHPPIPLISWHLARLHWKSNQIQAAWKSISPLLNPHDPSATHDLPTDWLDLAWTISSQSQNRHLLIPALIASIESQPHHQTHWRELHQLPAPTQPYLTTLSRLAEARASNLRDPRLTEHLFQLACLHPERQTQYLLQAHSSAHNQNRHSEWLDLVQHCQQHHQGPSAIELTQSALQHQLPTAAATLLASTLILQEDPMQTAHLRLLLKTHTISPIQAASHWQRHIQQYPHDTTAHRELTTLWLQAGQPAAAIQHLLRTPPKHLSPELRRLTAELAAQQKNQRALTTALQRLAEANEAPPPPTS